MSRWATILAGGSGTRFWPLSTDARPKQFIALAGGGPLLSLTAARLETLIDPENILVVTGARYAARTRELLSQLPPDNILAEPRAASTGPSLAWATHVAKHRDPSATVLSLHADWVVGDEDRFRSTSARALSVAEEHDVLVTVGVQPTRAEIGYGYIELGEDLGPDAKRIQRFVEKPETALAAQLISRGALWNSGLFSWTVDRFFKETEEHVPEIAPYLHLLGDGKIDEFFKSVTPIAVDRSHYERSSRVAVVIGDFPWDDVGTWAALKRVRELDSHGNVKVGEVFDIDATNCVAWSEEGPIVISGVSNLAIIRANGVTLVTTLDRAAKLKEIVATLPPKVRELG